MRISSVIASRVPGEIGHWYDRSPQRTRSEPLLERGDRRGREAVAPDERVDLGVLAPDHRARDLRALRLEAREERLDERAPDAFLPRFRIDAEELDPPGRLLEAELTATDFAQHEPDDLAADLGHLRRVGVAADVVHHAVFPGLGPVLARDALVDLADRFDV